MHKMRYFYSKIAKIAHCGAPPLKHLASESWRLCPQTPSGFGPNPPSMAFGG